MADLTARQWVQIEHLFPSQASGRGRPRRAARDVVNGILWVCRTGAPWKDLPSRYPPYQTCHRYFQTWNRNGVWDKVLYELAEHLRRNEVIDLRECFIDGTFSSAKKGGLVSERLNAAKALKSWQLQTLLVFLSPYGPTLPDPTK